MVITVDLTATIELDGDATPSQSYIHPGGTIVALYIGSSGGGRPTTSSVTFNSVAPDSTPVDDVIGANTETNLAAWIWNDVDAVTANFAASFATAAFGSIRLFSLSGANTTTPVGVSGSFSSATLETSYSNDLTSVPVGSMVLDMVANVGGAASTLYEDSGQTEAGAPYAASAWHATGASYKAGNGTVSMGWTWTGSLKRNQIIVAIAEASAVSEDHTISFSETVKSTVGFDVGMTFVKNKDGSAETGVVTPVTTGNATDVIYNVAYDTGAIVSGDTLHVTYDDTAGDITNLSDIPLVSFVDTEGSNCEDA